MNTMTLLSLHALLLVLAGATAAAAVDDAAGGGNSTAATPVVCNGEACEPPGQPLPIYGYPPPSPSTLPSAPPTPPCPPVPPVICCGGGGAAGQNTPQQPYYYAPPTGYLPYYNKSASPRVLLAPVTFGYYVAVAYLLLSSTV